MIICLKRAFDKLQKLLLNSHLAMKSERQLVRDHYHIVPKCTLRCSCHYYRCCYCCLCEGAVNGNWNDKRPVIRYNTINVREIYKLIFTTTTWSAKCVVSQLLKWHSIDKMAYLCRIACNKCCYDHHRCRHNK